MSKNGTELPSRERGPPFYVAVNHVAVNHVNPVTDECSQLSDIIFMIGTRRYAMI